MRGRRCVACLHLVWRWSTVRGSSSRYRLSLGAITSLFLSMSKSSDQTQGKAGGTSATQRPSPVSTRKCWGQRPVWDRRPSVPATLGPALGTAQKPLALPALPRPRGTKPRPCPRLCRKSKTPLREMGASRLGAAGTLPGR